MSTSLKSLEPWFEPYARALIQVAREYRLSPRVTSTYRSIAEQKRLYERRIRGEHPYPVARPGRSQHNYGLAFDITAKDLNWLGSVWKYWGGFWVRSDPIHFGAPK